MATKNSIKKVARNIAKDHEKYSIIVVVSAMNSTTGNLISQCLEFSNLNSTDKMREVDSIISSGEIISAGLLSLELQENFNLKAKSV